MPPSLNSNLPLAVQCVHAWTLTPQSKSYWPLPKYDNGVIGYHKVCLKCGEKEFILIADFREQPFVKCAQCVYPDCNQFRQCQHQSEAFTSFMDWVDKVTTNKGS